MTIATTERTIETIRYSMGAGVPGSPFGPCGPCGPCGPLISITLNDALALSPTLFITVIV